MSSEIRNCTNEVVVKMIGKITLQFDEFKNLERQRCLKSILEECLYGHDIISQSKELIISDLNEKINTYLLVRKIEGLSDKTLYNYKLILNKFEDCFFSKTVSMITTMDVRYFLAMYKKEKNVKNSTINSLIFCLKKFFAYLVDSEIIVKNPMSQIKEIKVEKRLKRVMTDAEVETLKDSCINLKEQCLLNFALDTGCRVSEISDINISNIDFKNLICTVIGKGDKERYVYFTEKTKLLLMKYIGKRKQFEENEALFLSNNFPHQRIKSRALELTLDKIKNRANLGDKEYITMHGCRRWLGSHLINKNTSLESIRQILGHANPSTTLIYSQMNRETINRDYRVGI